MRHAAVAEPRKMLGDRLTRGGEHQRRTTDDRAADLAPWLWGINGATSVCASVLAVVVALTYGISMAFWTGFFCYAIAAACFAWASRGLAAA
jgi:hypothetical protein